jgi:sugar transferase (PEP-CTERM system associated)
MIRLFRVFIPKSIMALVVLDAVLIFACFLVASVFVYPDVGDLSLYLLFESGLLKLAIAVGSTLFGLYFQNLYSDLRVRSVMMLLQQAVQVIGVVFITQALLAYFLPDVVLSRRIMIVGSALSLITFPPWRIVYANVLYKGFGIAPVLFLGTDVTGVEIAEQLVNRPELGFSVMGFVDEKLQAGAVVGETTVLGCMADIPQIVTKARPARIVVNLAERRMALPVDMLLDLRFSGIRIEEASSLYEATFGRVTTRRLRPSQLIFSTELGPQRWNMQIQTLYSFLIALIALIAVAPIMLLVAIAVRVTSRGPVLFRQERVGLNGALFTVLKFRSMTADAEAATGAVWAKQNDPRVTSIGGFLRKTRLDELPQLFNVLTGKMSIVGPRPERPEFVNVLTEQIPFYRQRHAVKPGVTGWAQINYKYGETIQDTIVKLEYDLYYIKNLSPALDFFIMFHTIKVMLFSSYGQ